MGPLCFTNKKEKEYFRSVKVIEQKTEVIKEEALESHQIIVSPKKSKVDSCYDALPSRGKVEEDDIKADEGEGPGLVNVTSALFVCQRDISALKLDYEELEEIETSPSCVVKKVLYKPSNQMRLMKIIKKEQFLNNRSLESLKMEIEILKKLVYH